jgi:hypothetical protein
MILFIDCCVRHSATKMDFEFISIAACHEPERNEEDDTLSMPVIVTVCGVLLAVKYACPVYQAIMWKIAHFHIL